MKKLTHYEVFLDGRIDLKATSARLEGDANVQNDFGGISPGGISLFQQDIEPSQGEMVDSMMGCRFIMASTKIGLWNFQTEEANLFGINNPFSRKDYTAYLNTLPRLAVAMLDECMEEYNLPDEGAVMFGVDGMIKVLPSHLEDRYYIIYPDGEEELISNPNTTLLNGHIVTEIQQRAGRKTWDWIKKKVSELIGNAE